MRWFRWSHQQPSMKIYCGVRAERKNVVEGYWWKERVSRIGMEVVASQRLQFGSNG